MKKRMYLTSLLLILLLVQLTSASIFISSLNEVYNVGDEFNLNFEIAKSVTMGDFVSSSIECSNESVEIYKSPLRVSANEGKKVQILTVVDEFLIGDIRDRCYVIVKYANESAKSNEFEITSEVDVEFSVNSFNVMPGSTLDVKGFAIKKNGVPLNGLFEVSIERLGLSSSSLVSNGGFNISLGIPSNARASSYELVIIAKDIDANGNVMNKGSRDMSIRVPQIVTSLDIAVSSQNIQPGEEAIYNTIVYDQAGEYMVTEGNVSLIKPDGGEIHRGATISGQEYGFETKNSEMPGNWKIVFNVGGLKTEKIFSINEFRNASFILTDGKLIVQNTGNVPYYGVVSVRIGDEKKDINVEMSVGGSQRFNLYAPDGEYPVSVKEGNQSLSLGNTLLTGRSVDVKDADSFNVSVSPVIWWIIALLILAYACLHYYRKSAKRNYYGKEPSTSTNYREPRKTVGYEKEEGKKQECAVVSVNVRNISSIESVEGNSAMGIIMKIIEDARAENASVYNQGSHKTIVFSPEKSDNPLMSAIKFAKNTEKAISEYNSKFAMKIDFGIGVSNGMMIVEKRGDSVKFTSVGTTVTTAKRLAEQSQSETLISGNIHRAVAGKIKTAKISDNVWRVTELSKREDSSEFIKRFMKRNS